MYSETSDIDLIQVLEDGTLQVRRAIRVRRDGVLVASTYHRHGLRPGDDLIAQDARVAAIASAIWTPDVVSAYRARVAAELVALEAGQAALKG